MRLDRYDLKSFFTAEWKRQQSILCEVHDPSHVTKLVKKLERPARTGAELEIEHAQLFVGPESRNGIGFYI